MLCLQIPSKTAVTRGAEAKLHLPRALVEKAGMQPGVVTVQSETGRTWQTHMTCEKIGGALTQNVLSEGWRAVAAALQLEEGQSVCLAAITPSRLVVSREGEPHNNAAQPWPFKLLLTQYLLHIMVLPLSRVAGATVCTDGDVGVPTVIVPSGIPSAGKLWLQDSHIEVNSCEVW